MLTFAPVKDNTLYQSDNGSLSNGAGDYFFAGTVSVIGSHTFRRGLIAFDLQSIPPGAVINSVTLSLYMSKTRLDAGDEPVSLHRVLKDWGEAGSDASLTRPNEGQGAAAQPGDATWLYNFFDTLLWDQPGGDFNATASASIMVGDIGGYTWGSTQGMLDDVHAWVNNPAINFGWLVQGRETDNQTKTAKRFDSRENPTIANRPELTVDFTPPPTADLGLSKTVNIPLPRENKNISYTINLTNNGPDNATQILVSDILPDGVSFVSAVADKGTYQGTPRTWSIASLAHAGQATLTLSAVVDAGQLGNTISNTATIAASDQYDPVAANNSASAAIQVVSGIKGDINDDGTVNLADAIVAFRISARLDPGVLVASSALVPVDVDDDGRLGVAEAIYALQTAAGLRQIVFVP